MKLKYIVVIILLNGSFASCKKFTDIDPPRYQLVRESVFANDATANAALMGIYTSKLAVQVGIGGGSLGLYCGLSADDFVNASFEDVKMQFFNNSLLASNYEVANSWSGYSTIYQANALLEGLSNAAAISDSAEKLLTAEAKFIRAFIHFYLVNLFGDVPYITSTEYAKNILVKRQPVAEVYDQIVKDLLDAIPFLPVDFAYTNGERVRPVQWTAYALLSRIYLYLEDWQKAEKYATMVIGNHSLFSLVPDPGKVFLKNNSEAIWQLAPVNTGNNTPDASMFIPYVVPVYGTYLQPALIAVFETGDARKTNWINSMSDNTGTYYYPYKYKVLPGAATATEYSTVFRLAELYLIRAEARIRQDNTAGSVEDIDVIRHRAGLNGTNAADATELLAAIELERRKELFSEWGHRWFDLKRTGRAEIVLKPLKGNDHWQNTDQLYPIPNTQIQNAPNMRDAQNPGYQ